MIVRADLHVHTRNSSDSLNSISNIVNYARKKNICVIGITDHNFFTKFELECGIKFLFGEEIKTREGEIIGFFIDRKIKRGLNLKETIKEIKEQNGIVCVPHPLDRMRRSAIGYKNLMDILEYVDIIEVFNSRTTFLEDNLKAMKIARENNKLMSAGSDAHIPFEIGACYLEIEEFKTKEEFLERLRNPRIIMGLSPFFVHIPSTFAKIYNKFNKLP